MMNVIEAACEPIKADAMDRAEQVARQMVANAKVELEAAGNDLQIVAPYPKHSGRVDFMTALAKYHFFQSITASRATSRMSMHAPNFVDVNPAYVEKFVKEAREDAAFQYEAFVAKLNKKIGACTEARLEGNHVWSHSHLYVTLASGETQTWKTQMIINVSKLGKLFNQFPTRKVKA